MDFVDWSELPSDLVEKIATMLNVYVDYVRLRAVCVKWRSTLPPKPDYLVNQFPWLMLSPESELLPYGEHHGFHNLLENKVHRLNMRPIDRPWSRCCGSSHGWLVLLEERGPKIILFNPITRVQNQLPPITTFPNVLDFNIRKVDEEYLVQNPFDDRQPTKHSLAEMRDAYIKKVVLSTSPTSLDEDFIVVAIFNITAELAFCKKGDEGWTIIEYSMFYDDVIYYEGIFYAVRHNGTLASFDVTDPSPSMKVINLPTPVYRRVTSLADKRYLVDSFGELLMVHRFLRVHRLFSADCVLADHLMVYNTIGFEVVRLNSMKTEWVKVESLGDRLLFLGSSLSVCLLATDFSGCNGNCIYFTGEFGRLCYRPDYYSRDSGIFDLGDGSVEALPNCIGDRSSFLRPPVWLSPNPC